MAERDLSRNEQRVQRSDRKVDRRQGILPEIDNRQRQLETYGNMRSARRGSGGAETILRSLGMLEQGLQNAQGVAQKQHEISEEENYEQALMDHMLGETSEDRMGRSEAYRRGLGMAQTETRWHAHKAEKDAEFQAFLEQQEEPTLEGRLRGAAEWIEKNYFEGFVKDPETGDVLDMGHKDGYLLALGQVQRARPQLLAAAGQRISTRFEGEAVTLFQDTVRNRVMAGEEINIAELIDRVPPTVPQEQVTAAYLNTVTAITGELERLGRHQEAVALVDQALGLAEASLPEEDRAAIVSVDPDAAMTDAPVLEQKVGRIRIAADKLAEAVMWQESRGNANAVSPKGAVGTMQTMPGTLTDPGYGVRPAANNSPEELERVGRDYLKAMVREYDGSIPLALAAYNAGPGNVNKWISNGTVPDPRKRGVSEQEFYEAIPFAETKDYVAKVTDRAGSPVTDSTGSDGAPVGDPNYQPNGSGRSVRERSFDPSAQLLPELEGRFAANAEQRQLLLQQREALVNRWDRYETEKTEEVYKETAGAFALRLTGNGPPLTRTDIQKAHKEGRMSDQQAASWYESIQSAERADEAYQQSQQDRRDREDERRVERAARAVIGSAAMEYFDGGGDPRQIITNVMGNLQHIPDDLVRAEAIGQAARLAQTLEGANLATPEAQAYERNVRRASESLGNKLPRAANGQPLTRFTYIDPRGREVRVTRDEAEKLAEAKLGELSLEAMTRTAQGEKPTWAETQAELQEWYSRSFRAPARDATNSYNADFDN